MKDRPFLKLYVAGFLADTAGMTDSELGKSVRMAMTAWSFGDSDRMPKWMLMAKEDADRRSECAKKSRSNVNERERTSSNVNERDRSPISSLSSLSLSSVSHAELQEKSMDTSTREAFSRLIESGPPSWEAERRFPQALRAYLLAKKRGSADDALTASAASYARYCAKSEKYNPKGLSAWIEEENYLKNWDVVKPMTDDKNKPQDFRTEAYYRVYPERRPK